ncbi:hypothetical protein OSB04_005285 [Centaurea solstitialis]|uniref:SBP-type domain-containing protein n=1 Tax=Centaurea solstitialis TaxID=347529 RepID=A0AA38TSC9_9ASTR|nr:hypothetical protein OSB04_005285 [Centaurea solstitialis]
MDSWSFNSVGKDFTSDESLSTSHAFDKDQIGSMGMGWEVKPPFIFANNMGLFPNETINNHNQVFGDMGFPPLMKNPFFNPPMAASQNSLSEEIDSSSKHQESSNSRECGLFDLKLGRLIDPKQVHIFNPSKIAHNSISSQASTPSKRPREAGFGSSIPFCKVYGCNKNLSGSKDYHRRHKVCEAHSKSSKVIVNGIEQRFCQQCSRFHLLREFDDGKRSCRKRLAGHNERRRKPHAGVLSERCGRLLPSYNIGVKGTYINVFISSINSNNLVYCIFILFVQGVVVEWLVLGGSTVGNILRGAVDGIPVYLGSIRGGNRSQEATPQFMGRPSGRAWARLWAGKESKGSTRAISSFHIPDHLHGPYRPKPETNGSWRANLEEKMAQDLQSISCVTDEQLHSKSFPPYNFETNPRFDGIVNNAPIGLSGIASSSECALSLLSPDQSRSTCNSSRSILTANMFPGSHSYQDSGPLDEQGMHPMVGYEDGLVKFGPKDIECDDLVFPDEGCTIDLLQLSSQLQRVEDHQKRRSQMKLVNGVSVGLRIT